MSAETLTTEPLPEGWTSAEAYALYLEDADGGRAPFRQATS